MPTHKALRGRGIVDDTAFLENSAFVDPTSSVGARSYLGNGVYVAAGVTIGTDCIICDRVRVTSNVPNGTTIVCDCCGGGGGGGSEDMILVSGVFAYEGFVPAGVGVLNAAPGTADWEPDDNSLNPPKGTIPVNPLTGLNTLPVRLVLSLWVASQSWDTDAAGNMSYSVVAEDGTVLATGTFAAAAASVGKTVLIDTTLLAGIITNTRGVYVAWTPNAGSGEGQISQRLNLTLSATPAP